MKMYTGAGPCQRTPLNCIAHRRIFDLFIYLFYLRNFIWVKLQLCPTNEGDQMVNLTEYFIWLLPLCKFFPLYVLLLASGIETDFYT